MNEFKKASMHTQCLKPTPSLHNTSYLCYGCQKNRFSDTNLTDNTANYFVIMLSFAAVPIQMTASWPPPVDTKHHTEQLQTGRYTAPPLTSS